MLTEDELREADELLDAEGDGAAADDDEEARVATGGGRRKDEV